MSRDRRQYGRVLKDFWRHEKTRPLSSHAKLLVVYLATSGHWSCIRQASVPALAVGMGMDRGDAHHVREALSELQAAGMVEYDDWAEVVWLVEGLKHQISDPQWNKNMAKAVENHLSGLPLSPLIERFRKHYTKRGLCKTEPQIENGPEPQIKNGPEPCSESGSQPPHTPDPIPGTQSASAYSAKSSDHVGGLPGGVKGARASEDSVRRGHDRTHSAWVQLRAGTLEHLAPMPGCVRPTWGASAPAGLPYALGVFGGLPELSQALLEHHDHLLRHGTPEARRWWKRAMLGSERSVDILVGQVDEARSAKSGTAPEAQRVRTLEEVLDS